MADRKISDLTALTTPASGDYLPIVDISEAAAASKNKRITIEELMRGVPDGTAAAPGIAFETYPSTGIYSPGADQLAVATNGTGRLFVDASGNVSVGSSSASAPLYVRRDQAAASYIMVDNVGTVGASTSAGFALGEAGVAQGYLRLMRDGTGNVQLFNAGAYPLTLGTNNQERLRITSAGLVGIGSSSPSELLTVAGNARLDKASSDLFIKIGGTTRGGNTYSNYIDLDNNGYGAPGAFQTASKGDKIILWGGNSLDGEARIGFSIDDSVWIKAMGTTVPNAFAVHGAAANSGSPNRLFTITKAGLVGIGTASPLEKLEIQDGSISVGSSANTSQANTLIAGYGYILSGTKYGNTSIRSTYNNANNLSSLEFYTSSSATASTERARIDSDGRLLVGTSSALGNITRYAQSIAPTQQIVSNDTGSWNTGLGLVNYSATGYAPVLTLGLSASNTKGTNTLVSDGHRMGVITFNGNDGTDFEEGARIEAFVDGTPGANDMPGRLVFSSTPSGSASPVERLRITSTGQVRLAGAGITFNGDTAAANELDDYEEGTFTPTVIGGTTAGTATYAAQAGHYTKIGRQVNFAVYISWSSGTGTGELRISGLPFTIANLNSWAVSVGISDGVTTSANTVIGGYAVQAGSYIAMTNTLVGGGTLSLTTYDAAGTLLLNGSYAAT
jgi:hypothetical protein